MKIYPGVKAHMGRWDYYLIKMTMKDLGNPAMIKFGQDFHKSALSSHLQRTIDESRARKEIVRYLSQQEDRFFNSIVIAAVGGEPKWMPISMADDPRLELLADDPVLNDSFGVLKFTGTEEYYALDGQHRLFAIRSLVDPSRPEYRNRPAGFDLEEVSVVLVIPNGADTIDEFKRRFRRLFGHLNRYAKPMDGATSIIMDEDDTFAICTRRLFSDYEFFESTDRHEESSVVDVSKGKNMKNNQIHFTKLEVLYEMNISLLTSSYRRNHGFDPSSPDMPVDLKQFIQFRPDDQVIEDYYSELTAIWDALFEVLPDLREEPSRMRTHAVANVDDASGERDCLLFWPIGQRLLADVARNLIDQSGCDLMNPVELREALAPLARISWDMDQAPWRNFVLVRDEDGASWKIRSEDRKPVMELATNFLLGLFLNGGEEVDTFQAKWSSFLLRSDYEDEGSAFKNFTKKALGR